MENYVEIQQKYYKEYMDKVLTGKLDTYAEENDWKKLSKRYRYLTLEMMANNCDYVTRKMSKIRDIDVLRKYVIDSLERFNNKIKTDIPLYEKYGTTIKYEICGLCNICEVYRLSKKIDIKIYETYSGIIQYMINMINIGKIIIY